MGYQDFEMTYYFARDTFNTLNYAMLDADGNTIATFPYLIAVGGDGSTASEFHVDSGAVSGDATGTTLEVKDGSGTVHTITGDQAQGQAATLKQFCAQSTAATCAFTATSETAVDGPTHVLFTETNNGTAATTSALLTQWWLPALTSKHPAPAPAAAPRTPMPSHSASGTRPDD